MRKWTQVQALPRFSELSLVAQSRRTRPTNYLSRGIENFSHTIESLASPKIVFGESSARVAPPAAHFFRHGMLEETHLIYAEFQPWCTAPKLKT